MISLLLDQGIPRSTTAILRDSGFSVEHVADIGMSTVTDIAIIEYARQKQRGIVTLDADFHALLAVSGAANPSVLRIRKEGLRGPEMAKLVRKALKLVSTEWNCGFLVTVTDTSIRLHRLPILPSNHTKQP